MDEPQSNATSLLPTPSVRTIIAVAGASALPRIGLAPSSSEPPPPPTVQVASTGAEEAVVREARSCIFPFTCWPLKLLCCPSSITKVQDWLHLLLLCGVIAAILGVINVYLDWNACGKSIGCHVELVCSLFILPSTFRFIAVIVSYDEYAQRMNELEKGKAKELATKQAAMVNVISTHVENLSGFADRVTQKTFKEKMNVMELFLNKVESDSKGLTVNDTFPRFKEFVAIWVSTLGKARMAHGQRENDPVDKLVEKIRSCESIAEVRKAWKKGTGEIVYMGIKNFWQAVPVALDPEAAERDLERGTTCSCLQSCGFERGACSRLCGGHARCGASWLRCGGARRQRPACCKIVREVHEGADPLAFGPYTMHVLGVFAVKILSAEHLSLMLLLLMDIVLMIVEVHQVWTTGMTIALDVVVINSVCILSMLLCFEQIYKAQEHAVRVEKIQAQIDLMTTRKEELEGHYQNKEAYHDALEFRTFPLLDVMGKVVQKYSLDDQASQRGAEIFKNATDCIQAFDQAFGPLQDWLGKKGRLSVEWKEEVGNELQKVAEMQSLEEQPDEKVLDVLLENLRVGAQVAAGAAPKFIAAGAANAVATQQQTLLAPSAAPALLAPEAVHA